MGIFRIAILGSLVWTSAVFGRPVSYTDSFTFMTFSNYMKESVYVHYSPSYKQSIGVEVLEDKSFETSYGLLRYTRLLMRKNTKNSQANFYFISSLGLNETSNYSYGVQGDWETREYFLGFKHSQNSFFDSKFYDQYVVAGMVPYVGEYGDLHTWVMLKARRNSYSNETHTYPILKFFKGDTLLEVGFDNRERLDLHFIRRF